MFSTKKIEKNEQEKNVKDNNLEVKKGEKLESLKIKIKELDNNINIDELKGDLDKDLLYYERLYNELSKKKEEEKAEENSINTTIEESNIQFDNTYEQGQSPNLNSRPEDKPIVNPEDKPVEVPVEKPIENPEDKPEVNPTPDKEEKPTDTPEDKPNDAPEDKPTQNPNINDEQNPENNQENI